MKPEDAGSAKELLDLVIVGAGPAGMTAALYAGRLKLKTKVLEKFALGGQTLLTEAIENYPGIYGMNITAWVEVIKKQLGELESVDVTEDARAERIEEKNGVFKIHAAFEKDDRGKILSSRCLIIATGAKPKRLGVKGEEALIGRGVSFCATCDAPLFKNKEIVVVGGGDTAIEEALYLSRFAAKITIVHRRDSLRATALLQDRLREDKKIVFKWGAVAVEVLGKEKVSGLKIKDVKSGQEEVMPCEGVFVFIGFIPETAFLEGLLDRDEAGYILTDEKMCSSYPGVFASGDCRLRPLKQVVTACAEGAIAAESAGHFLMNKT